MYGVWDIKMLLALLYTAFSSIWENAFARVRFFTLFIQVFHFLTYKMFWENSLCCWMITGVNEWNTNVICATFDELSQYLKITTWMFWFLISVYCILNLICSCGRKMLNCTVITYIAAVNLRLLFQLFK